MMSASISRTPPFLQGLSGDADPQPAHRSIGCSVDYAQGSGIESGLDAVEQIFLTERFGQVALDAVLQCARARH